MDEVGYRFELLRGELAELQQGIRNWDTITFQVKGWAVTVGLAAAGLSLSLSLPSAALLGVFSSVAFLAIDAHRKVVQRRLITRSRELEVALLESQSIEELLVGKDRLDVPGIARVSARPRDVNLLSHYRAVLANWRREILRPGTVFLYLSLLLLLGVVAISV